MRLVQCRGEAVRVGVPTETKADEYRAAITPAGVHQLTALGHEVVIEAGAGEASAISDSAYVGTGARIVPDADAVFDEAELVLKVKEPQSDELARLRPDHTLFTYLHLAPAPELTRALCDSGATCIAYETVEDEGGRLPLLTPMSEVAGKIATQAGAFMLQKPLGGRGVLLGGVPGVPGARVVVVGGGVVGLNAALVAVGMGAEVHVLDSSIERLRVLDVVLRGLAATVHASAVALEDLLPGADLVIGAVLLRGGRAPYVLTREHLGMMRPQAVLVDVSIDQGGCFETSRPTTHSDPTYELDGISHYAVANMPGAVPITSTYALTNATLEYVIALAELGLRGAMAERPGLRTGVTVAAGRVTHPSVAEAVGLPHAAVEDVVGLARNAA
jgi:alanine dehydrogenase